MVLEDALIQVSFAIVFTASRLVIHYHIVVVGTNHLNIVVTCTVVLHDHTSWEVTLGTPRAVVLLSNDKLLVLVGHFNG